MLSDACGEDPYCVNAIFPSAKILGPDCTNSCNGDVPSTKWMVTGLRPHKGTALYRCARTAVLEALATAAEEHCCQMSRGVLGEGQRCATIMVLPHRS